MANINVGRVLLGGLAAGVVYNIGEAVLNMQILAKESAEMVQRFNLPPIGNDFIAKATILMFVFGIVNVLLYALIRPRLGATPKTAVIAGLLVWFLSFFYFGMLNTWMGLFPMPPTLLALGWELVEAVLASLVGAWVYKEEA